jgi:hypothetical protein
MLCLLRINFKIKEGKQVYKFFRHQGKPFKIEKDLFIVFLTSYVIQKKGFLRLSKLIINCWRWRQILLFLLFYLRKTKKWKANLNPSNLFNLFILKTFNLKICIIKVYMKKKLCNINPFFKFSSKAVL